MTHIDGGIWANCPTMVGVVEAVGVLGCHPSDVDILSVGTTSEPFFVSERRRLGGIILWNKGISDLLMQAQVASSLAQAKVITGRRPMRINESTQPGRFAMDDARQISDLKSLGISAARHHEQEVSDRFLATPAERFIPYYPVRPVVEREPFCAI